MGQFGVGIVREFVGQRRRLTKRATSDEEETKEERKVTSEDGTDGSLLESALRNAIAKGEAVEIYRDGLSSNPIVGVVLEHSGSTALVAPIVEDFTFDGVCVIRNSDITRVKRDDGELRRLGSLSRPKAVVLGEIGLLEMSAAGTVLSGFGPVVAHLEAFESAYVGWFREVDDGYVRMECLGTARTADSYEVIFSLGRLSRLEAGSRYISGLRSILGR